MDKVTKTIRRTVTIVRTSTIGAGVYTFTLGVTLTPLFNLTIIKVFISAGASDSVTFQNIEGQFSFKPGWNVLTDNPGFPLSGTVFKPTYHCRMGDTKYMEAHRLIASGAAVVTTLAFNLSTVTANPISYFLNAGFVYECPADYLSVDAFAANP